ncbi:metal ABC transporter substrate-binding protein [Crenobacter sp. SG2303]|uniref:Metal ABC transporter substrate-binding protein n=1 Tax=Crenobacter oryzisoli TaxID=3056844 RepID=A0ABT7XPS8_9NEIS|nr:metal ABC transporter substrate-binding protein [Crenobacter sp. SG2303]MDN0075564.1 metal ABC transporter substrate-binding protein [Crenobacter sp. SG2303]
MKKLLWAGALLGLSSSLWAAPMPVVASFSVVADLTRQVGGDRVEVSSLVGPNQDAHVFQPTPSDVKKVAGAKVFVVNGLGFEGWINRLSHSANFKGVMVEGTKGVTPRKADEQEEGHDEHGGIDPHAFQDPARVQIYVKNIAAGLAKADPAGASYYQTRAASYTKQLKELDAWAQQQFAKVPLAQRKVLTSHDAFGYLGDRYKVRFLAPQGVSTETEASAKGVAMLINQVKREKVKAVFFENMTDPRLLKQLSSEAGVKIGGKLYSDALSPADGPAATYLTMFRYNVSTIMASFK